MKKIFVCLLTVLFVFSVSGASMATTNAGKKVLFIDSYHEGYAWSDGMNITEYYAKDFEDYKKGFLKLQDQVDMLLIDSDGGLYKDRADELRAFMESDLPARGEAKSLLKAENPKVRDKASSETGKAKS